MKYSILRRWAAGLIVWGGLWGGFVHSKPPDDGALRAHWLEGAQFRDGEKGGETKVSFDYVFASAHSLPDAIAVKFSAPAVGVENPVEVLVTGFMISASNQPVERVVPAQAVPTPEGGSIVEFRVGDLQPDSIYGLRFSLSMAGKPWSEPTDIYYAPTAGTDALGQVRAQLVTLGLAEWDHYGKRGTVTVSGTRYGAGPKEAWCSEFYAWLTAHWLKGIAGATWVGDLRRYFQRYQSEFSGTAIPREGRMGDYLSLWGDEHSAMLLGYELSGSQSFLWTLEGNVGSRTRILRREFKPSSFRLGKIISEQLKYSHGLIQ